MADRARVAFFLPALGGGGAERVMVRLANGLSERVDLSFLLGVAAGPNLAELGAGVNKVDFNVPRALLAITSLARYIRVVRPDAVMSTLDYANISLVMASRLAGRHRTRIVLRQANAISEFYKAAPGAKARVTPYLMKLAYRQADCVVAVSREARDELVSLIGVSPERVRLIPNPVDPIALAEKAKAPVEHGWIESPDLPVIIGLGNLRKEKDFANLVRAFAIVSKTLPSRLMLLGDGPERSNIEQLVRELDISDTVAMPGFVQNPYPYIAASSVLVLSSVSEGMPNSLLEAMALGVNTVSTDCGSGPREVLDDGAYGRLVPVGNPDAMADAIIGAIESPTDPETLRGGAARFAPDRIFDMYMDALLSK